MLGYFIVQEEAEKLELVKNLSVRNELQKVYFVVTDRDIEEHTKLKVSLKKFDDVSNYLNKNYHDAFVESIAEQIRAGS